MSQLELSGHFNLFIFLKDKTSIGYLELKGCHQTSRNKNVAIFAVN